MEDEAGIVRTFPKKGAKKPQHTPLLQKNRKPAKNRIPKGVISADLSKAEPVRKVDKPKKRLAAKKKRQTKKEESAPPHVYEALESSSEDDDVKEIPQVNVKKTKEARKRKIVKFESDDDDAPIQVDIKKEPKVKAEVNEETMEIVNSSDDEEDDDEMPEEQRTKEVEEDETAMFRKEVSNLSLAQIRELRDQLGLKLFNKMYFSKPGEKDNEPAAKKKKEEKAKIDEKKGQHRPREISSKKPVSSFRNVYKNEKLEKKKWDPRFDERAGAFKEHCFDDNYQFLKEIKQQEKTELRKELYQAVEDGDEAKAARLKMAIQRADNQEVAAKEKDLKRTTMTEIRQENIDRMMSGQRPVFLRKAEVKQRLAEKKFDQLKAEGRLEKYLEKKAKKNAQKAKKQKPDFAAQYQ